MSNTTLAIVLLSILTYINMYLNIHQKNQIADLKFENKTLSQMVVENGAETDTLKYQIEGLR